MMDLLLATSGGEAQAAGGGYVDDVFSAYTYTGNGVTRTINNGIDLAGNGGLVWIKDRSNANGHFLTDSGRGVNSQLRTHTTVMATASTDVITSFNANGFSLGGNASANGTETEVAWTFRKAPKFFDIVTYTGNGASNRTLSHQLNADVGMITVKATSTTGDWWVFHRSATGDLVLNTTAAQTASKANIPSATSSTFTVNGSANTNGVQYVAYLFAHDPSADGIIQCGSFTTDASGNATVNLGWEPQFLITKSSSSEAAGGWNIFDQSRNFIDHANYTNGSNRLFANKSAAESVNSVYQSPTATGSNCRLSASVDTYIYLAIRRQNKPPTSGTQVYNAIAVTPANNGRNEYTLPFAPDFVIGGARFAETRNRTTARLVGGFTMNKPLSLYTNSTNAEVNNDTNADWILNNSTNDQITAGGAWYQDSSIFHCFRRAKGVFDIVCDTGTGAPHGITHGLSVAPEFIIRKSRSGATQWECWHSALAATEKLVLNSTAAKATDATAWNSTLPTSTQFTVGTGANVNTNAATYVTYLFATLADISKVGSYTGNGTSQTINCGFATGARFILVKRTDATGDWYVWDSVRGIIAANDPHLSLNTTAAEVTTDDSVDPEASGFIVNQDTATNINVSGGQYIFLAIA